MRITPDIYSVLVVVQRMARGVSEWDIAFSTGVRGPVITRMKEFGLLCERNGLLYAAIEKGEIN